LTARRGDSHRFIRWLWTSGDAGAKITRGALLPASALWSAAMATRRWAYRRGISSAAPLALPSVAVGNLSVGGSGKTPITGWIAAQYAAQGIRPAILLRGVGDDEVEVHRETVPEAIVIADPDRRGAATRAVADGAVIAVLDDAYQRLDIRPDLNICLISAESTQAVRWPLPAGPWREGFGALDRADLVIVTRKRASREIADGLVAEVRARTGKAVALARLDLSRLRGLVTARESSVASLSGQRVVVASAIADPASFVAQVKRTGAQVQVATWKDHHIFRDEDVAWLAHAARRADRVVVTAKDAVKLRHRWPASVPEPSVALLDVTFEAGEDALREALGRVVGR
jgi:tetraacyldisaccharide 4'-kinase